MECLSVVYIGHYRDKEGYSDNWYDALDQDNEYHYYYFTPPAVDGDLYITVETYY